MNNQLPLGVTLMLVTSSLWALGFIAPLAVPDATAIELSLGRFIVYGLISVAAIGLKRVVNFPAQVLLRAFTFALTGNIAYYVLLVLGIQLADAAMAILIIGMLPVTVSVLGQFQTDRRVLRAVALPFLLFSAGVLVFNAGRTDLFRDVSNLSLTGTLCITSSLAMWTWYAVANARFLKATPTVTASEWSSVIGVMSLFIAIIGLPIGWALGLARDPTSMVFEDFLPIAFWSVVLGGGSTWLGTVLFNAASKLLDVSILGQLIIFETVFGAIYLFWFASRIPSTLEFIGLAIAIFAVWLSIRCIQRAGNRLGARAELP